MKRALLVAAVLLLLPAAVAARAAQRQHQRMHPVRAAVALTEARAVLPTANEISFVTADGLRLDGWYAPSTNGAAVVLAGGVLASRDELLPEAVLLHAAGFGVLLFDWRAHGTSEGTLSTWGDLERQDLRAAIEFALSRPDVTRQQVGVFGLSMGGAVAVRVASEDPRVAAVAIAGTYPTLEETTRKDLERWGPLSQLPALWTLQLEGARLEEVRPIDQLCRLSPRPVLIFDGSDDPSRVTNQSERMFAAACEPKTLHVVPGAQHGGLTRAGDAAYPTLLLAHFARMVAGLPP